jgi:hypothetical protein
MTKQPSAPAQPRKPPPRDGILRKPDESWTAAIPGLGPYPGKRVPFFALDGRAVLRGAGGFKSEV